MNEVICSATNSVVSMDYCLSCALNQPAPCGYDYALIKRVHKALQPREGIHVTDLVHCLRRAYYHRTQPVPERVSDVLYRVLGTATHSILEDEQDNNLITELPLEHAGLVGQIDAYYPEKGILVDSKTTRWLTLTKLPYGDHEMQVNLYRWLLHQNGFEVNRIFLHYIDLSGPSKCRRCKLPLVEQDGIFTCPVCGYVNPEGHHGAVMIEVMLKPLDEIDRFIRERKAILESGEMPEAEPGYLCNYCQFNQICPDSRARKE